MSIEPANEFRVTCLIAFNHPMIGEQRREVSICPQDYSKEIAPARTFGFVEEIETLRRSGLARGGSLENAIALTRDGMLNPEPLRFEDEFVRHKILDIIGDLALAGMPVLGHVRVALRAWAAHDAAFDPATRQRPGRGAHQLAVIMPLAQRDGLTPVFKCMNTVSHRRTQGTQRNHYASVPCGTLCGYSST